MTASRICVRFLNGDERHFDPDEGSTLLELKVFSAKELRRFAPEVSIFCADSGKALEGDERADIPAKVIAVMNTVAIDRDFWKRTFVAHGRGNDTGGVLRALEAINSGTNNDIRGIQCLTEVFLEQLHVNADPDDKKRSHCIDVCLRVGVDVHQRNDRGETCLMLASRCNELDVVNQLLDDGAQVNVASNFGSSSLHHAANIAGSLPIIDRLLVARAHVDHETSLGYTPLMLSSRRGIVEVVDRLLAAGADPNHKNHNGNTSLQQASGDGTVKVVDRFIGHTTLMRASSKESLPIVDRLLKAKADVNQRDLIGWTPLMRAARGGRFDTVSKLLKEGARVDHINGEGRTSLMYASDFGHLEIVRILEDAEKLERAADEQKKMAARKSEKKSSKEQTADKGSKKKQPDCGRVMAKNGKKGEAVKKTTKKTKKHKASSPGIAKPATEHLREGKEQVKP